jgi:hypothetical protein
MYASEKYVKLEVKTLKSEISSLGTDLGEDIQFLHNQYVDMYNRILELEERLKSIEDSNEV